MLLMAMMEEIPGPGTPIVFCKIKTLTPRTSKSIKDCPRIQTKLEEAKMIITYKVWSSVALQAGGDTLSSKVTRVSLKESETLLVSVTLRRMTSSLEESWYIKIKICNNGL